MFEALRWRLTLWYVLAFAVVFVLMGTAVFVLAQRRLSHDVDAAVRTVSDEARATVEDGATGGAALTIPSSTTSDELREILTNESLGGSADVFVLLADRDGKILANPGDIPTDGLPDMRSVERARTGADAWSSSHAAGRDLRIRTIALRDDNGDVVGFIQAGKSLAERNSSLRTLIVVMAGGGVGGTVLATIGGLFLARLAIGPVQRSFEAQQRFVADASHELRTPLSVIRANAESLSRRSANREAVDDIVAEATYMTRLINDLLALAASDAEGVHLIRQRIDLADVARSAERVASALAAVSGVQFTPQIAGPLYVEADAERCREALLALLDNAVKYTPQGGRVGFSLMREHHAAVVEVSDTGAGIAQADLRHVFERFYRVDKARSRSLGGAGLGLAIARTIADAHGGSLQLRSIVGQGTTATLKLPLMG